jgi:hypothetical protein
MVSTGDNIDATLDSLKKDWPPAGERKTNGWAQGDPISDEADSEFTGSLDWLDKMIKARAYSEHEVAEAFVDNRGDGLRYDHDRGCWYIFIKGRRWRRNGTRLPWSRWRLPIVRHGCVFSTRQPAAISS